MQLKDEILKKWFFWTSIKNSQELIRYKYSLFDFFFFISFHLIFD